jgi:hypothetical protein
MKGLIVAGLLAASISLPFLIGRGNVDRRDLEGEWFATIEFVNEKPVRAVVTFGQTSAAQPERAGFGQWTTTAADRFAVSFLLPGDTKSRRISGVLTLDRARERLHGCITAEFEDESGKTVVHHGAMSAKRLNLRRRF